MSERSAGSTEVRLAIQTDSGTEHIVGVARGSGLTAAAGLFEFVGRFFIAAILARALDASGYGIYNLAISTASIFVGISMLGLDDAMVRYVAIQMGRRDPSGVRGTMQLGIGISAAIGVVLGLVLYLAAEPVAVGFFDEAELVPILHVFAFIVPFLTLSNCLLGITRGFGRVDQAAFAENVVQTIVRLALLSVLYVIGLDVFTAAVIFGIADVAASIVLIVFVRRLLPYRPGQAPPPRREARAVFGFAIPIWISGLLNQFRSNVQTFALGAMSIAADVGIFSVAARVNGVSHVLYRSVIVAVKPSLATLYDQGETLRLRRLYSATTRWTLTVNLPFFLVMVLYPKEILSVFGGSFVGGATALVVLAFGELAVAATGTCGSMIDMAGHTRVKVVNSVVWIALVVGSSVLLIPEWGVLGAAMATAISTGLINVIRTLEVWLLDGLHPFAFDFWKPLVAGGIAYGIGLLAAVVVPTRGSFLIAAGEGVIVGLVFLGLIAAFGIHDDDRMILGRAGKRLKGRARRGEGSRRDRDGAGGKS